MKRIAILTYSRAYNYGSALQTYALNRYLSMQGNEVKTIDYTSEEQQRLYTIFEPINGLMALVRNLQSFWYLKRLKTHKRRFDDFIDNYVPMTSKVTTSDDFYRLNALFEYFICGSDQIWNTQCDDYNPYYMLSFVTDKKKCIAYAPSLGAGGNNSEILSCLATYVKGYKAISSREQSSLPIIKEATGRSVVKVLDPVFLLEAEQWSELVGDCPIKGEYILGYFIGNVEGMRDFAAQLSQELDLPVVVIWKSIRDVKYGFKTFYEAGPLEFVSLVKGAKFVVTNSFHAVSFSLLFSKSFWAFVKPFSSDDRIRNILNLVGLTDRLIDGMKTLQIDKQSQIDFKKIDWLAFNRAIELSKNYLKHNIGYETM